MGQCGLRVQVARIPRAAQRTGAGGQTHAGHTCLRELASPALPLGPLGQADNPPKHGPAATLSPKIAQAEEGEAPPAGLGTSWRRLCRSGGGHGGERERGAVVEGCDSRALRVRLAR